MKIPVRTGDDGDLKMREDKTDRAMCKMADANANDMEAEQESFPHYKRVSDYLLGSCIGEGSFAKVRVGLHCPTKEKVAIKIINKAKAKRDSYVFKNLHREGKIMQMVQHPNVVQVFDILETGNNYYLVTELCSGGELIEIVTEKGSLNETTVRRYTSQLVNAVAYLHEKNIVHRDLKVENILLDSDDNIKIIDFGLSNTLTHRDTSCPLTTQCGSPAYAAPELLAKKPYGPKVDVWSIGVITFALLAGKLPFTVEPFNIPKLCRKMQRGEMNPIPASATTQCRIFIRKLLQPDHQQRPSIGEVAKMRWVANQPSGNKSLRIDSLSFSRRSALASTTSIDSLVIKEMGSTYGFSCADAIQCVQKNRPGPALATYHLLLRKRRAERAKKRATEHLSQTFRHHIDLKAKNGATERVVSDAETRLEAGRPVGQDASLGTEEKKPERGSGFSHERVPTPNREVPTENRGEAPVAVAPAPVAIPATRPRENGLRIDIAPDNLARKPATFDADPVTGNREGVAEEHNTTPPVQRARGTEVKNIIANMRRRREALERKSCNRRETKETAAQEASADGEDSQKSPYKEALWPTERPFRPLSMRRTNPEPQANRPSTAGQTRSTEGESALADVAPRPLSQNGATTKRPSKVFAHRKSLYSQASPKLSRYTPDWLKSRDDEKVHTTLPAIVTKPESNGHASPFARGLFPTVTATRDKRDTRHSLPAYVAKSGHKAQTRNGTAVAHDDGHLIVNRSKLGYYLTKASEAPTAPASRPKKTISEPIAAAISYLTSSKHRNARRDKVAY